MQLKDFEGDLHAAFSRRGLLKGVAAAALAAPGICRSAGHGG